MGNENSTGSNRMAVSAMSHMMKLNKPQLLELRDRCLAAANYDGGADSPSGHTLSRDLFLGALSELGIESEPDRQVLEKLFVMWDKRGLDRLDPVEFLTGVSPLSSVMDVATKLKFALEVFDYQSTGRINRGGLVAVLGGVNATASYLGDAVLTPDQVRVIVEDVFESAGSFEKTDTVTYSDKIHQMTVHPLVVEFASGAGTARHGTG